MKYLRINLTLLVILICICSAKAQVFSTGTTLNWNLGTSWSTGIIPGAGDDVVIRHAVVANGGNLFARSITIINNNGVPASLTLSATVALIVGAGGITVTGDPNAFTCDLVLNNATVVTINGNLSYTNSIAGNNAASLRLNNTSQLTVNGDFTYSYLANDATPETKTEIGINQSSVLTVNGNLGLIYNSVNKISTLQFLPENSSIIHVTQNFNLTTTECGNAGNRITLTFGTAAGACTSALTVDGNFNVSNNDTSIPLSSSRNTVEVTKNASVTVGGNFNMTSLPTASAVGSNQVRFITNSTFTLGGNLVFDAAANNINDNQLHIGNTAASASIFDMNGNVLHVDRSNGTTSITNPRRGTIRRVGVSSFYFSGTVPQVIPIVNNSNDYSILRIDNSSGAAVTLQASTSVIGTLQMVNGIVDSGTPDRLILSDQSICTGGNSASYVINGVTKIGGGDITLPLGTSTRWAPVLLSNITGANINLTAIQLDYFNGIHPIGATDGTFDHRSGAEYWNLQMVSVPGSGLPITPPVSLDATFYWKDACFSEIEDVTVVPQDLFIGGFTGVRWEQVVASQINAGSQVCNAGDVTPETGSITASLTTATLTSYSHYTFVAVNAFLNTLPVELISFAVNAAESNEAMITWETASELTNWKFVVEKSTDGIGWVEITEVEGLGTSSAGKKYAVVDPNPYPHVSYYRLAQYDYDGTLTYSSIRSLTIVSENKLTFSMHPNPSKEVLHISSTDFLDNVVVHLYDATGAVLMTSFFPEFGRKQTLDIHSLNTGRYLVSLSQYGRRLDSKQVLVLK